MAYPQYFDTQNEKELLVSGDEKKLIDFREQCLDEYRSVREQLGVNGRHERAAKFLTPDGQWPKEVQEKSYLATIAINVVRSVVERKTGALTESKAQLRVKSTNHQKQVAETLEKIVMAVMDERDVQDSLTDGILLAQRGGMSACGVTWNQSLDYGMGDIDVEFWPDRQIAFQPTIRRAARLQRAEWVIINNVIPVADFSVKYPRRGHLVKRSDNLSTYDSRKGGKIDTPVGARSLYSIWKKGDRKKDYFKDTAIPLATESLLYLRDPTLNPERPYFEDGRPNYIFPRKRLIISSGDVLLYDGPSKYWDGLYPVELFDWGIEVDHPFGESEVEMYRSLQNAINYLISGTVQNAALMNDPQKKVNENVDPELLADLEDNGKEPGRVFPFQNLNDFDIMNVTPFTGDVLTVAKMLMEAVELMSGMSEVTQGKVPQDVSASSAIEQLVTAAQTIIRLQGRKIERFLERIGRLLTARIIQYYTGERIFHYFGVDGNTIEAVWKRTEFIRSLGLSKKEDGSAATAEEIDEKLMRAHRDFTIKVTPFSSLEGQRLREIQMAMMFRNAGLYESIEVLKAARIADPEDKLAAAQREQAEGQKQAVMAKLMGGQQARQQKGAGSMRQPAPTPSPLRAGIGS